MELNEFTKTALNAMKARKLAKSYGLIPESGSAWKWALRHLRKGKTVKAYIEESFSGTVKRDVNPIW